MSDILQVSLNALYRTSPTAVPSWSTGNWPIQTNPANHGETHRVYVPNLTQITRSFSHYSTIDIFAVFNAHATSRVEVSWRTTLGFVNTQVIAAQRLMAVPNVDPNFNVVLHAIDAVSPVLYIISGT